MESLDITKEGFEFKYEEVGNPNRVYTLSVQNQKDPLDFYTRDIIYNDRNNWLLIVDGDADTPYENWKTRFSGYVETQEDFQKLLTQLP